MHLQNVAWNPDRGGLVPRGKRSLVSRHFCSRQEVKGGVGQHHDGYEWQHDCSLAISSSTVVTGALRDWRL